MLLASSVIVLKFTSATCGNSSSLFMAEIYPIVLMDHKIFIHSPVDGQSGCFHCGGMRNEAEMDIYV